ncbi:MAG: carboxylating nicotinate-nucleotide diphosphorylase [Pseudomonadota bacterium]
MTQVDTPDAASLQQDVALALAEDLGTGDVTAALIPPDATATAHVISREAAVVAGRPWFDEAFRQVDPGCAVAWQVADGEPVAPDTRLCTVSGPARAVLTAERTALNFLQLLSGTATTTARYAQALAGTACRVLDTRKTVPGLRLAQKYAVRCGGGLNHRIGLYDGILIKENHLMAAGGIAPAIHAARRAGQTLPVEVEVESLAEAAAALDAGADRLLLDNFTLDALRAAVGLVADRKADVTLEASGNVTLDTLGAIAETGVDYISVGALTKHVTAIDLSMRFALDD